MKKYRVKLFNNGNNYTIEARNRLELAKKLKDVLGYFVIPKLDNTVIKPSSDDFKIATWEEITDKEVNISNVKQFFVYDIQNDLRDNKIADYSTFVEGRVSTDLFDKWLTDIFCYSVYAAHLRSAEEMLIFELNTGRYCGRVYIREMIPMFVLKDTKLGNYFSYQHGSGFNQNSKEFAARYSNKERLDEVTKNLNGLYQEVRFVVEEFYV